MKRCTTLLLLLASLPVLSAPFQNLNFEQARTNSLTPIPTLAADSGLAMGPAADLLPGWQVFQGTKLLTSIGYNLSDFWAPFALTGGVTIVSEPSRVIEGKNSLSIRVPGGLSPVPFALVQRGDIPADARYLVFSHDGFAPVVRIDGGTLFEPAPSVGFRPPLQLDILQFAGKNVELEFSTSSRIGSGSYVLDNILFVVPEPSTTALIILGSLAFAAKSFWPRLRYRQGSKAS
jgi:hypothetical protein